MNWSIFFFFARIKNLTIDETPEFIQAIKAEVSKGLQEEESGNLESRAIIILLFYKTLYTVSIDVVRLPSMISLFSLPK